jgi:hypothetical protein
VEKNFEKKSEKRKDKGGRGRSCVVVQSREREGKGEVDSIVSECKSSLERKSC